MTSRLGETDRVAPVGIVHGVPDSEESRSRNARFDAVLFDFHGTLAQVEDPIEWVVAAAATCGADLDRGRATVLADRLVTAGRAGGPLPCRIPPHLAEEWADRDLRESAHRAAYTGLAATVDTGIAGLPDALYERCVQPIGWRVYADTVETLRTLRTAGLGVAVVSNIGFDIRGIAAELGFADLVDSFVLSYEVGRCKPDPAIFGKACASLRADPERTLVVGDTLADAGAVRTGCVALILPETGPSTVHGLASVLDLAMRRMSP
jgi:HAD superfamily hydrolase (TIGR01509 family)